MFKEFKGKINDEQEFYVRDRNNLEDYIFELNSPFLRKESATQFDLIDMVFVVGDANLRPWSPTAEQIIILLRMCMKTNKMLFACSFGFQGLVFLSASNFEKPYKVINGVQNGSQISDLLKSNINPQKISLHDIFIDNVTGDILTYNFESCNWVAKGNAGLHYNKAAQEFTTIGKYILKAPTYQANTKDDNELYLNSNVESICKIKKKYLSHWAFKDVGSYFKVPSKNQWDAHPFNCVNRSKQFWVLAESQRGPQIIESKQMFAIQFVLSDKYPETILIMRNYLSQKIDLYQSQKFIFKSIEAVVSLSNDEDNPYYLSRKKQKRLIMQREIKFSSLGGGSKMTFHEAKNSLEIEDENHQFKHVGLSANHQHNYNVLIDNNSIINQQYSMNNLKGHHKSKSIGFYNNVDEIKEQDASQRKEPILFKSYKSVERSLNKVLRTGSEHLNKNVDSQNQENFSLYVNQHDDDSFKDKNDQNNQKQFSKIEVRKTLHPSLSQETLFGFDKTYWVPDGKQKQNQKIFVHPDESQMKTNQEKTFFRSYYRNKLGSSHSQIQNTMDLSTKLPTEPYKTQEEIERQFQRLNKHIYFNIINNQEQDKKILGTKRFFTNLSNNINQSQINYSTNQNESKRYGGAYNVSQLNSRNMTRLKWISTKKQNDS